MGKDGVLMPFSVRAIPVAGYKAGGTDVAVADGGTGASSLTDGGVLIGSGTSAVTAMAVLADGEMIVGDGTTDPVAESGATLRTSIGVGTGNSPQFTAIELGHASDTTIARSGSGAITVEGTQVLLAGAALTGTTGTFTGVLDITDTTDSSDASGDTGALRTEGGVSIAKKLYVGTDLDVDGTTNLDAVDIDGAVQVDGAITVGTAGSGQDVTFYSGTSGDQFLWDASEEKLVITGTDGANALEVADGNVAITDNLTVSGNFTVSGTTTTVDTTNLTVTDPLIKLAQGTTASPANDLGIIFTRGNGSASNIANRAILWDESADIFVFAYTNDEAGTTTGNVDIDDYASIRVGAITADDNSTFTGTISTATGSTIGNLTLANGSITDSSGAISFGNETLTTTGAVDLGAATLDSVTSTGDFTTTGQATDWDLIDNNASALSFDASGKAGILEIVTTNSSESVKMSGDLDVDGTTNLDAVDIDGDVQLDGTFTVGVNDTGKDVKFFGASDGAYMEWDESADQLRIMGASADATTSTGKLLLATSLTDINANDVLGKIDFQAPHEAGGTDAITVAASIQAVAQGTFSASVNATDLIFYTGHSEAATEKVRITSQGEIGIGGANYGSDGQVLTSAGAGAAVAWEDAGGGGDYESTIGAGGSTSLTASKRYIIAPGTTMTGAVTLSNADTHLRIGAGVDFDGNVLTISGAGCSVVCENGVTLDGVVMSGASGLFDGGGWDTLSNGGTSRHAMDVTGASCVVKNVSVQTTDGGGSAYKSLSASTAANYFVAENVQVVDSDKAGFDCRGESVKIIDCVIIDCDEEGVYLGGNRCTVRGLYVEHSGSTGISLDGNDHVVMGNIVKAISAGSAITLNNDNHCIVGNRLVGAVNDNSSNSTIASNEVAAFASD